MTRPFIRLRDEEGLGWPTPGALRSAAVAPVDPVPAGFEGVWASEEQAWVRGGLWKNMVDDGCLRAVWVCPDPPAHMGDDQCTGRDGSGM